MSLVKGTAVDCESSGGGVGQLTQVPQPASNFDPKTLRYGLLARTNAGLGEAMQVQSYCSPLMRNTFWNGSEWEKPAVPVPAITEEWRTNRQRFSQQLTIPEHRPSGALVRPAEAYTRAKAESATWSANSLTGRAVPLAAESAPHVKGGFTERRKALNRFTTAAAAAADSNDSTGSSSSNSDPAAVRAAANAALKVAHTPPPFARSRSLSRGRSNSSSRSTSDYYSSFDRKFSNGEVRGGSDGRVSPSTASDSDPTTLSRRPPATNKKPDDDGDYTYGLFGPKSLSSFRRRMGSIGAAFTETATSPSSSLSSRERNSVSLPRGSRGDNARPPPPMRRATSARLHEWNKAMDEELEKLKAITDPKPASSATPRSTHSTALRGASLDRHMPSSHHPHPHSSNGYNIKLDPKTARRQELNAQASHDKALRRELANESRNNRRLAVAKAAELAAADSSSSSASDRRHLRGQSLPRLLGSAPFRPASHSSSRYGGSLSRSALECSKAAHDPSSRGSSEHRERSRSTSRPRRETHRAASLQRQLREEAMHQRTAIEAAPPNDEDEGDDRQNHDDRSQSSSPPRQLGARCTSFEVRDVRAREDALGSLERFTVVIDREDADDDDEDDDRAANLWATLSKEEDRDLSLRAPFAFGGSGGDHSLTRPETGRPGEMDPAEDLAYTLSSLLSPESSSSSLTAAPLHHSNEDLKAYPGPCPPSPPPLDRRSSSHSTLPRQQQRSNSRTRGAPSSSSLSLPRSSSMSRSGSTRRQMLLASAESDPLATMTALEDMRLQADAQRYAEAARARELEHEVERLKAAKVLADVAKQRQAADVAALRQTVASLRSSIAKTKGEMASSPSSNNEPSNREDQVDHQRRELKRARAQELVLLEEGDTETRAKRTAEVDEMRERLREKEKQRAEERALAEQEALAEIEARAVAEADRLQRQQSLAQQRAAEKAEQEATDARLAAMAARAAEASAKLAAYEKEAREAEEKLEAQRIKNEAQRLVESKAKEEQECMAAAMKAESERAQAAQEAQLAADAAAAAAAAAAHEAEMKKAWQEVVQFAQHFDKRGAVAAFGAFDVDGSGTLETAEFRKALEGSGAFPQGLSDEVVQELMVKIDPAHAASGFVDFVNFVRSMREDQTDHLSPAIREAVHHLEESSKGHNEEGEAPLSPKAKPPPQKAFTPAGPPPLATGQLLPSSFRSNSLQRSLIRSPSMSPARNVPSSTNSWFDGPQRKALRTNSELVPEQPASSAEAEMPSPDDTSGAISDTVADSAASNSANSVDANASSTDAPASDALSPTTATDPEASRASPLMTKETTAASTPESSGTKQEARTSLASMAPSTPTPDGAAVTLRGTFGKGPIGISFAYDDLVGGLIVTKAEGAALQAGVQAGDSVMEVNGDLLSEECSEDDLYDLLTEKPRPVTVGFWRSCDSPPASTESLLGNSNAAATPEGPLSARSRKGMNVPSTNDKNTASAKPNDQPTSPSTWSCTVCKRENVASSFACSVCYTKKSGANKKSSNAKSTVNPAETPAAAEELVAHESSSSPIEVTENDTSVSSAMSPETAEIKSQVNAAGTLTAMKEMTEHYRKAETNDRQRVRLARRFEEDSGKKGTSTESVAAPEGEAAASNLGADFEGVATVNEGATTAPGFKKQDKKASKPPLKVDTAGDVSNIKAEELKKVTPSSRSASPAAAPAWAALQLKKTSRSSPDDKSGKEKEDASSDGSTPVFKANLKKVNPDDKSVVPKEDASSDGSTPVFKANLKKVNPDDKSVVPKEGTSKDISTPTYNALLKKVNPEGTSKPETPMDDKVISPTAGLKKVSSNDSLASSPAVKEPIAYIAIKERLRKVVPGSGVGTRPEPTKKDSAKAKSVSSRGLGRGPMSADKAPPPASTSFGRRRSGSVEKKTSQDNVDRTSSSGSVNGKSVPAPGTKDASSTNASPPAAQAPAATTSKKGGFFGGLKKRAESATSRATAAKSMLSPAKPAFASVTLKKAKSNKPKVEEEKDRDPDFGASASWLPPLDVGSFPPQDGVGMIWDRMREVVAADGGDAMKLFHFLDTAGSDTMTEPEFARALSRVGVCGISEKVMKAIMATSDLDKDGNLEYREIVAQLEKWYQSNKT